MYILYSLPFYLLSIILIGLFRHELAQLGVGWCGLIGIGLGIVSLLFGILIDINSTR